MTWVAISTWLTRCRRPRRSSCSWRRPRSCLCHWRLFLAWTGLPRIRAPTLVPADQRPSSHQRTVSLAHEWIYRFTSAEPVQHRWRVVQTPRHLTMVASKSCQMSIRQSTIISTEFEKFAMWWNKKSPALYKTWPCICDISYTEQESITWKGCTGLWESIDTRLDEIVI